MIRYALSCDAGHAFEAWFRSSADYDGQAERGLLSCPQCGSARVGKALMAPSVVTREAPAATAPSAAPAQVPVPVPPPPVPAALLPPEAQEVVAKLRELKSKLLESSENVGERFPDEARRIHYGEAPPRIVHGQASADEARALIEEGVGILPLPVLPEERN
jgi:hypothetical protein